mmetsp:Transcript_36944/g.73183  ORF Transcript_36944/g.73183 Transcript_36944/m.73183 type:complete len:153 (+) Transcript_36944:1170-1628(+)
MTTAVKVKAITVAPLHHKKKGAHSSRSWTFLHSEPTLSQATLQRMSFVAAELMAGEDPTMIVEIAASWNWSLPSKLTLPTAVKRSEDANDMAEAAVTVHKQNHKKGINQSLMMLFSGQEKTGRELVGGLLMLCSHSGVYLTRKVRGMSGEIS